MSNGIRSLPRYQTGAQVPPDPPGTGASRAFARSGGPYPDPGYGDVSERRQRKWDEQTPFGTPHAPIFGGQWARDIIGAQVRDRLGLETIGNWIGASDITAEDLSPGEYEALKETALRAMLREGGGRTEWSVDYPDYDFSLTDPEHAEIGRAHV